MLVDKDTIRRKQSFILKWAENPGTKGDWNPGWKQQTEGNTFLDIIENRPSIINDCRFHTMQSKQEDISYMRLNARLKSMKKLSGDKKGAQRTSDYKEIGETVPQFSRNSLVAEPFSIFTETPKTFLLENIEKATFLNHIESRLAEEAGYSAELIGMYGIKDDTTVDADGIHALDGVFKQLTDLRTAYNTAVAGGTAKATDPMGYFTDIDATKPLVPQVKKMITQFSRQRGKKANATLYVSAMFEGLLTEEADQRPTDKGDNLYFEDGQLKLWGVPIKQADFLDNPELSWGEQILLADPDQILFGFLDEIESENDYDINIKAYVSTVDVYFDVLVLMNKDVLAAKVVDSPIVEGDVTVTVTDGTSAISSASVVLTDQDGLSSTKSTNASGKATFDDIDNGVYTIAVTKDNYTSFSGTVTITGDTSIPVVLTPTRSVSFTVNDGTDAIQGATVTIDGDTAGAKTTGSSGGCTATLADGQHTVVVAKSGYETKTELITVSSSATSFTISLTASS